MKLLAFNSSPRMEKGATDIILDKFLEGAKDAGADIEKIYLKNKKINQCVGCFTCWTKTPGVCVFKDDMPELLEKMKKADFIVFATPLYIFNMTSDMQIFRERKLPLYDPHFIKSGNLTTHPIRFKEMNGKWIIISVCGFPEIEHFQSLDLCFEQIAKAEGTKIVGKIYRPASEMLLKVKSTQRLCKKYLDNCYLAGKEVVKNGRISKDTQEELYKDFIIPKFLFRFMGNRFWDKHIKK